MARCSRNSSQNQMVVENLILYDFPHQKKCLMLLFHALFNDIERRQPSKHRLYQVCYIKFILGEGQKNGISHCTCLLHRLPSCGSYWISLKCLYPSTLKREIVLPNWSCKTRIVTKRDKCYNLMFRSQSHISSSKNSNGKLCEGKWRGMKDESCGPKLIQEQII